MENAKNRTSKDGVYLEKHHIIPRCMGGNNGTNNIVNLTAREHFVAHRLLTKMVDDPFMRRKLVYAVICFKRKNPNHSGRSSITNSRSFDYMKRQLSVLPISPEISAKISNALRGKKRPAHVGKNLSNKLKGRVFSDETKLKMRLAKLGKIASAETRKKQSEIRRGKAFSSEHCANISKSYRKTETRSAAIREANRRKSKKCTIDGVQIFESRSSLQKALGRGKNGSGSPNFRYLGEN